MTLIEKEISTGKIHKKRMPPKDLKIESLIDDYTHSVWPNGPFGRSKAAVLDALKRELGQPSELIYQY